MKQKESATSSSVCGRFIGIAYRNKKVFRGGVVVEQRPTMVMIVDGDTSKEITLPDTDHEVCFRKACSATIPALKDGGKPTEIDFTKDGLRKGDTVLMVMGGSGGFFMYSLSRQLEKLGGGGVYQIGSTLFKRLCDEYRLERAKVKSVDEEGNRTEVTFDHKVLPDLFSKAPNQFHLASVRERDLVLLGNAVKARREVMDARMACEHRVHQRFENMAHITEDAYPEGGIKLVIEQGVANDVLLNALTAEEKRVSLALKKLLQKLAVWEVFKPIEGVGELTAAPLIVAIGDINRFPSASQLKAYLGVHVLKNDGTKFQKGERPEVGNSKFARRRQGQLSNWSPEKQSLYLISDQFLFWKKNSPWGLVAQEVKKRFIKKYPTREIWVKDSQGVIIERVPVKENEYKAVSGGYEIIEDGKEKRKVKGVMKRNPAHINRMVAWRTMTKFVEWLYKAWKATEANKALPNLPYLIHASNDNTSGKSQQVTQKVA